MYEPTRLERWVDSAVAAFAPERAIQRRIARERLAAFSSYYPALDNTRLQKSVGTIGGSADKHLEQNTIWQLRERGRILDEANTLAMGILLTLVDNVVANGFEADGLTDDDAWNEQAEAYIANTRWDARGILSNAQFQRLAFRSMLRDGDIAIQLNDGLLIPIEGDRIGTPTDRMSVASCVNGIEYDAIGKPISYWVAKVNPLTSFIGTDVAAIPAADLIFLFDPRRFSASRGTSLTGVIFDQLQRLNQYVDSTVIAAQIAACFGLFFKSTGEYSSVLGTAETNPNTGDSEQVEELEPGMILRGMPGEDVVQVKPEHPPQRFPELVDTLCRFCGRHLGLPLELVLLNFSHSNFSNTRAAILQAQQTFRAYQNMLRENLLTRVWRYMISYAVKHEKLAPNPQWWRHQWRAPGWPWLDPLKDVQADILAINNGLTTRSAACAKRGEQQWMDIDQQQAREKASRDALGLSAPTTERSAPDAEQTQAAEE